MMQKHRTWNMLFRILFRLCLISLRIYNYDSGIKQLQARVYVCDRVGRAMIIMIISLSAPPLSCAVQTLNEPGCLSSHKHSSVSARLFKQV